MSNQNQPDLQTTINGAAFYALVCLIPIFVVVVTYGWGKILQPILPVGSPFDSIIAYIVAIFLSFVGVILAKIVAVDRIQISLESDIKFQFWTWITRCWAYILVLLVISALGTTRTIFTITQAPDVLSNELSETGTKLRNLQVVIESSLSTPEYDAMSSEYKTKRVKTEALISQFENDMQRVLEVELSKLNNDRATADSAWTQFESEMKNPQNCGFGQETAKRFKELQTALKGNLNKLSGDGTQCSKVPEVLAQYKNSFNTIKDSIFIPSQYNCGISSTASLRLSEIQAVLPDIKPLQENRIACDKMTQTVKDYAGLAKSLNEKVTVPESKVPFAILEFKKKSTQEIQQQLKDIDNIVVNSAKTSTDEALPVLRKSWETYRKNLSEAESLAGKKTNLPKDIKREEVENIENLTNILRILISRWDNFMTYFTVFAAVLMDLILIAFFRRHLSARIRTQDESPYGEYASGDNIFRN